MTETREEIPLSPKLLTLIADWHLQEKVVELVRLHSIQLTYMCVGDGTASSEILDWLGIGRSHKMLLFCLGSREVLLHFLEVLNRELELMMPGHGVAFTISLSGLSGMLYRILDESNRKRLQQTLAEGEKRLRQREQAPHHQGLRAISPRLGSEVEKMKNEQTFELIMTIVNQGFTDDLMNEARNAGATGGTVLNARGTSGVDTRLWGIAIQEEKEIVLILAKRESSQGIMKAINTRFGLNHDARGLVFSLPVEYVAGLELRPLFGES
ncbi:MAG: hypothetical protein FWF06_05370 [Symbiobacteriaceae bacterium]|nr:hypothetical protein [Symbiobacteriaceae bacterium]